MVVGDGGAAQSAVLVRQVGDMMVQFLQCSHRRNKFSRFTGKVNHFTVYFRFDLSFESIMKEVWRNGWQPDRFHAVTAACFEQKVTLFGPALIFDHVFKVAA